MCAPLILGICIEAMCSPTSVQPLETVLQCLRALSTLLGDPWPREQLGKNSSLCVELLNVLHRSVTLHVNSLMLDMSMG